MTNPRPAPNSYVPASVGQFVFECVAVHCPKRGTRWTYTPIQEGDGLVLLPNWVCVGCGCAPETIEYPTWGA